MQLTLDAIVLSLKKVSLQHESTKAKLQFPLSGDYYEHIKDLLRMLYEYIDHRDEPFLRKVQEDEFSSASSDGK